VEPEGKVETGLALMERVEVEEVEVEEVSALSSRSQDAQPLST
jgi:hypothetical protein